MQIGAKAPTRCKDRQDTRGRRCPGHPCQPDAGADRQSPIQVEVKDQEATVGWETNREGGQLSLLGLQQLVGDTDETATDTAVAAIPGREGSVRGGSRLGPIQGTKRPAHGGAGGR